MSILRDVISNFFDIIYLYVIPHHIAEPVDHIKVYENGNISVCFKFAIVEYIQHQSNHRFGRFQKSVCEGETILMSGS